MLSCFSVVFSEELSVLTFKVVEAAGCSEKVCTCEPYYIFIVTFQTIILFSYKSIFCGGNTLFMQKCYT